MVPCGSGNGMAASAGLWTPATAAHAVCKGCIRGMDILSLFQPPDRRYYAFLSLTFGLIANLDIGTESLRPASFPANAKKSHVSQIEASKHQRSDLIARKFQ